jgi:hypothetical protein
MTDPAPDRKIGIPLSLPDHSLAIPRSAERRDLYPIRQPDPPRMVPRKPSLAARRRRRLTNS